VDVLLGIVAEVPGAEEAGVAEVEVIGDRHVRPNAHPFEAGHVLAGAVLGYSTVTWWGWMRHRKMVLQSRSSIGRFSVTSEGVTRALRG
jgi:hypothetical protein